MRERRGRAKGEQQRPLHWYQRQHSVYKLTVISLHTNEIHEWSTKEVGSLRMGNGKRESNGCTVHFNSILQLLIYKPQSINKTLIKLEISKEASFFFYSFVFLIFFYIWTLQGFFFSLLFKLLLDHTSISFTLEVSSIFLYLVVLKSKKWDKKWVKTKTTNTPAAGKVFQKTHHSFH